MKVLKGQLNAKAELALMGRVVFMRSREDFEYVLDYIAKVLHCEQSGHDIYENAVKHLDPKKTYPIGLSCSTIGGEFKVATLIMKDVGESVELDRQDGVFCYCYNFTRPDFSELGYSYFEKQGSTYHRVG